MKKCMKCKNMFNLSDLVGMKTESTRYCSHCIQDAWDLINNDYYVENCAIENNDAPPFHPDRIDCNKCGHTHIKGHKLACM